MPTCGPRIAVWRREIRMEIRERPATKSDRGGVPELVVGGSCKGDGARAKIAKIEP